MRGDNDDAGIDVDISSAVDDSVDMVNASAPTTMASVIVTDTCRTIIRTSNRIVVFIFRVLDTVRFDN